MARLTSGVLAPAAAVVLLAAVAWLGSPQSSGVLDRAADALEAAHVAHFRTSIGALDVDFDRRIIVIERPVPGVRQRRIFGDDVYDLLADGTWLHTTGVPAVFAQNPADQLRGIDADVGDIGGGRYRFRANGSQGELVLRRDGVPVSFRADVHGTRLSWELLATGGRLRVERPAARTVSPEEWFDIVAQAAGATR